MNFLVGIKHEFLNIFRIVLVRLRDDSTEATVSEAIDLRTVDWLPCS